MTTFINNKASKCKRESSKANEKKKGANRQTNGWSVDWPMAIQICTQKCYVFVPLDNAINKVDFHYYRHAITDILKD